jgi:predicted DNA-binding transcriptional regulator YafY
LAETSKIHHLLRLILLLQQDRAGNAGQLAESLGVVQRTVYRYIDALKEMDLPIRYDASERRYRLGREYFLPPVHLTPSESLALLALVEQVAGSEQVPLTRPAMLAIEKVRSRLNGKVLRELGDTPDRIHIRLAAGSDADPEQLQDVYDRVARAIRDRRKLRCRYDSVNGTGSDWFVLQPYHLWFEQRAWYCVGLHETHGEVRNLKLNRFSAIELTASPYAIPDDFSIEAHRGDAWRMVRGGRTFDVSIHFAREVAETVTDTRWHPTQRDFEYHDDGSVTFRCRVDGLDEICHWVLSYGAWAKVIEPGELAERVAAMAAATAARYGP